MIGKTTGKCLACQNGYYSECLQPVGKTDDVMWPCGLAAIDHTLEEEAIKFRGGQVKIASDVTDIESTGRKRAALMYPIENGENCEWQGLLQAGGGVKPIIGCVENKATAIHHGPDKNTLNNNRNNIHKICTYCHNYWHARNDEFYGERPTGSEAFIPLDSFDWTQHDSVTKATEAQLAQEMVTRSIRKDRRK
jgi:hypothetical protein